MSIYDFSVKNRQNEDVSLADYKGKVLLVVNTATGCGFTPQYEGLEKLYSAYHEKGLEVLDFPCDQFGHQAPGTDDEIHEFCSFKYHTTFDQFKKIEVNGPNALPLFKYLEDAKAFSGFTGPNAAFMDDMLAKSDPNYKTNPDIKWNFTKFLIDRDGKVLARYESTVEPETIENDIKKII
ncbi:MAG: glutathione peroxidase [Treponema sp.]|nr:glutathione peroxidase [Treponema sp.]